MTTQIENRPAEEAFIGCCILDSNLVNLVDKDDLYLHSHRFVYEAIGNVKSRNAPVDFETISNELATMGQLDDIRGPAYLASLINQVPSVLNAPEYARQVKEAAYRRMTVEIANKLAKAAHDLKTPIDGKVTPILEGLRERTPNQDRDSWPEPYSLADAYKEREPVTYIVESLNREASLSMLYGPSGDLKTMLLVEKLMTVAAGEIFLPEPGWSPGGRSFSTYQATTAFIDFDNGDLEMHERIEAIGRAHGWPDDLPFYYWSFPVGGLLANKKDHIGNLALRMQRYGIRLIGIDNLGVVKGGCEENSDQMIEVMNNFRWLVNETGAAIELNHHQRKTGDFKGRAGDNIRGHTSIEASLDLAIMVEREPYSDTITLKDTKHRGAAVMPFGATFTYTHKPGTSELETARFYSHFIEDTSSDYAIENVVLEKLDNGPKNQKDLIQAVKDSLSDAGFNRIRDVVVALERSGKIATKPGSKNEKVYFSP